MIGAYFRCRSTKHNLKDCPKKSGNIDDHVDRSMSTSQRGRKPRKSSKTRATQARIKNTIVRSEA